MDKDDELTYGRVYERDGDIHLNFEGPAKMRDGYVYYHEERPVAAICKSAEHTDKGAEFAYIKIEFANINVYVESKAPMLMDIVKTTKGMANAEANKKLACAVLHLFAAQPAYFLRFLEVYGEMQRNNGRRAAQSQMRDALGMND